jgi:hypothetical protein
MPRSDLVRAANRLSEIIESFNRSQPLIDEAYAILRPLLNDALTGNLKGPGELPHRTFFFGMQENSLPAHYLKDVDFMNAIAEFDDAWRHYDS